MVQDKTGGEEDDIPFAADKGIPKVLTD